MNEIGLVDFVVKIINTYFIDINVCEIGCQILQRITTKPFFSNNLRSSILDLKGEYIKQARKKNLIRTLLDIMNNYVNSVEICSSVSNVLIILAFDDGK